MKMPTLLSAPIILDWMSNSEKSFRSNISEDFTNIPQIFPEIDSNTYKLEGFFDNGIQSVVARIRDKNNTYVVKTSSDGAILQKEFEVNLAWQKQKVCVVRYLNQGISRKSNVFVLMEYIPELRANILLDDNKQLPQFMTAIGKTLRDMHNVIGSRWGTVVLSGVSLDGEYRTFEEYVQKSVVVDFEKIVKETRISKTPSLFRQYTIEISSYCIENKISPSLCHGDLGLHNILGIEQFKIIDGNPAFSFPFIDLAISYIWMSYLGKKRTDQLISGYIGTDQWSSYLWERSLFIALIIKLNKWIPRSASEPKVKTWIENAIKLLAVYR